MADFESVPENNKPVIDADIAESDNTLSAFRSIETETHFINDRVTKPPITTSFFNLRPSSYHRLSIFSCLCCCCPVGLSAFIYSYKCRRAKDAGDFSLAERHSKTAKELTIASIVLGVFLLLVAGLVGGVVYFTVLKKQHP